MDILGPHANQGKYPNYNELNYDSQCMGFRLSPRSAVTLGMDVMYDGSIERAIKGILPENVSTFQKMYALLGCIEEHGNDNEKKQCKNKRISGSLEFPLKDKIEYKK